jgi:hypothetical protein
VLEEKEIILKDGYDTDKGTPITERFVTKLVPQVYGNSVLIDGVRLTPKADIAPVITVVDAPSHTSNETYKVYCIDYPLLPDTNYFEATITIED